MTVASAVRVRPVLAEVRREDWPDTLLDHYGSGLVGTLGVEIVELEPGRIQTRLELQDGVMLGRGDFLHGGTVAAFADSTAGFGCMASLPADKTGFATMEMTLNLVGSTRVPDALLGIGTLLHGGRTTQVWDVAVTRERDGRPIAHFRCTQVLEAPR
jgi:uncharacterized protein (TIGR00369 family)